MIQITVSEANDLGYTPARILPNGKYAWIMRMLYTFGLYVSLDEEGTSTRYCYHTWEEAELALKTWDGENDPPGNWIKQKPEGRNNPNYKEPTAEIE